MQASVISSAIVLAICFVSGLNAFPEGAPLAACADMIPRHDSTVDPNPCPYETIPSLTQISQGGSVTLTLQNITNQAYTFKGYLTMAFDASKPDSNVPIGAFASTSNGHTLDCLDIPKSAITHNDVDLKKKVTAVWNAPSDFVGTVVFKTTWVRGGIIFWDKVASAPVTVGSAAKANYRVEQRA